jgi:signal transduction histidine kinase
MILRRYFSSMAGRLFVVLLAGVLGSAAIALTLADAKRHEDLRRIRLDRLADRINDFLLVADRASELLRAELLSDGVTGIRRATGTEEIRGPDLPLTTALREHVGRGIEAQLAATTSCFTATPRPLHDDQFACWVVSGTLSDGEIIKLQVRGHVRSDPYGLNPLFILVLGTGIATLAFIAARMAASPLRDLSNAARALGRDLERHPLPERGPIEVREAARAFNAMQARLRSYVVERTQMLAAVTHDLQTPMTRLRLRLEKVEDSALRSRLIDDLGTMQALLREGLDYARSLETNEPFARLSVDSLLDVVADEASGGSSPVVLAQRCGCDIEARPRALQRCLANLISNALKYGGSAEVSASLTDDTVHIRVRDHGPGIPADKMELVFEPFFRLESSAASAVEGVGLGLTIAKMLAEKNEAEICLRNHPEGGLEASVVLKRGVTKSAVFADPETAMAM